jgi:hypothetical protein
MSEKTGDTCRYRLRFQIGRGSMAMQACAKTGPHVRPFGGALYMNMNAAG